MRFFLLLLLLVYSSAFSQEITDSLYSALEHHPQRDTIRVKIMGQICYSEYLTHPEKSKAMAEEILYLSREIYYVKGESIGFRYLAEYYFNTGDHGQATKYAYDMLKAAEKSKYQGGIARAYQMLAFIEEEEHDFENAEMNYKKAIEIFNKANMKGDEGYGYNNLAGLYFTFSKLDKATEAHALAIEIMKELNNEDGLGLVYGNLGEIYLAKKEYKKAMELFNEAILISKKLNNQYRLAQLYAGMGELYLNSHNFIKAESYLLQSLEVAKTIDHKSVIKDTYHVLIQLERKRGKLEEALKYASLESAYRDSIYTEEKAQQIADAETRYETEKKNQSIQLLQRDKRIQQLWISISITAFILLAIAFIVVYRLQLYREEKNRRILNLEIDYLIAQRNDLSEKYRNALSSGKESIESQDQALLKRAIAVIEKNISETLFGVDKMGEELGMSRASLNRKLKAITGFPPGELIRNIRLRKAALLLRNNVDTITQISIAVGFEDQSYFSKSFKRQFGVTPSDYLRSLENKKQEPDTKA
jgi:AraC-like DNA-binding protein/tetratricopeptide (TPR) repeat protein